LKRRDEEVSCASALDGSTFKEYSSSQSARVSDLELSLPRISDMTNLPISPYSIPDIAILKF
jgi:hypothetical protein